ncbi:hypothetical protein ACHAXR_000406, partial [Thalassiosira sp. AJA248-18]
GIEALAKVAVKYPQTAYAGFTQSLHAEWQYLCRCVPGVEVHLEPVEVAIREVLIPALLAVKPDEVKDDFRQLLSHGVKQGGINIRNPTAGAERLHQSSLEACESLVASLMANTPLGSEEHKQCVRKAGTKTLKERVDSEKAFVKEMMEGASKKVKKWLERIGETGAWLSASPNQLDGNLLSAEEWRDNARLRFGMRPIGLCDQCDGCGASFTIEHGLNCKKGGLVVQRHEDARDEAGELVMMALNSRSCVSYEPLIFYGRGVTATQQSEAEAEAVER